MPGLSLAASSVDRICYVLVMASVVTRTLSGITRWIHNCVNNNKASVEKETKNKKLIGKPSY